MGGVHRGFAFVDFSTHQEAEAAMKSLGSAHLYGRHLVIEWANDDDDDLSILRSKAKTDQNVIGVSKKRQKIGDILNGQDILKGVLLNKESTNSGEIDYFDDETDD